jgi:hypothetical protein
MKQLADRTVPTKRKQALAQAQPIREDTPIFPGVCSLIRGNAHNRFMPIQRHKSLNPFNSPGKIRSVPPKMGTPLPPFFGKYLKTNRLHKMEDRNRLKINNLKIQAKITPRRNKGLTISTPSIIPGFESKSASFEPSPSRSIGQRPLVRRSCDCPAEWNPCSLPASNWRYTGPDRTPAPKRIGSAHPRRKSCRRLYSNSSATTP